MLMVPASPDTYTSWHALSQLGALPLSGSAGCVEHGGPGGRYALGRRLHGGDTRGAPHQVRVPVAGESQRQRKDRAVAVNHVVREKQRDALWRLLDGDPLQLEEPEIGRAHV